MVYSVTGTELNDVFNVKFAGVIGDGVVDDSDNINTALANNKRVYFPTGTYLISKTIVVPDGVEILGNGNGTIFKLASVFNLTAYTWRDSYKYPLLNVGENCHLSNFLVNGDETQARDQGQVGILIHGDNTKCENVSTKNINYFPSAWIGGTSGYGTVNAPGYGIFVFGANNVSVCHGSFTGNGYQGIGIESSTNALIDGCYIGDGNRTGIQVHRYSKRINIQNCIINNTNTNKHADLTVHGTDDDYVDNVLITGCKFISACEEKGSIQTVWGYEQNIIISECTFNSKTRCIIFSSDRTSGSVTANKIVITNNIFKSLASGISIRGDKCVVDGNIFDCASTDISIIGSQTITENNLIL